LKQIVTDPIARAPPRASIAMAAPEPPAVPEYIVLRPAKDMHDKVALHDQFVESMRPMMEGRVTANEIEICLACGRSLANALEDDDPEKPPLLCQLANLLINRRKPGDCERAAGMIRTALANLPEKMKPHTQRLRYDLASALLGISEDCDSTADVEAALVKHAPEAIALAEAMDPTDVIANERIDARELKDACFNNLCIPLMKAHGRRHTPAIFELYETAVKAAIAFEPTAQHVSNYGAALCRAGKFEEGIAQYEKSLTMEFGPYVNLRANVERWLDGARRQLAGTAPKDGLTFVTENGEEVHVSAGEGNELQVEYDEDTGVGVAVSVKKE